MAEEIDPKYRELMNEVAHVLDDVFNGPALPGLPRQRTVGFFLAAFEFNTNGEEGRFNYISNSDRLDVKVLLREMLARFEGQPYVTGKG